MDANTTLRVGKTQTIKMANKHKIGNNTSVAFKPSVRMTALVPNKLRKKA